MDDSLCLVGFERGGDGEICGSILERDTKVSTVNGQGFGRESTDAIENVDEFRSFESSDHDRSAFGIGREMLSGYDTTRSGATVRLLVEFGEGVGGGVEFEDDDPARVGADDDEVWGRSG